MDVYRWSMDPSQNIEPPPDGAPEGWPWTRVAEACREVMAAGRRHYEDPEWLRLVTDPVTRSDATTLRIAGTDVTAAFPIGSRVRMIAGASHTDANIADVLYDAGDTLVAVEEAEVPSGVEAVLLHSLANWASAAFREAGPADGKVPRYEDIRPFGEETEKLEAPQWFNQTIPNSSLARLTCWHLNEPTLALPDADGETEMFLSLNLKLSSGPDALGTFIHLYVFVGQTGSFLADPVVFAFDAPTGSSGPNTRRVLSIPMIPLGRPNPGDVISVYGQTFPSGHAPPDPASIILYLDPATDGVIGNLTSHHVRKLL